MPKRFCLLLLLCFSLALSGCTTLEVTGDSIPSAPNLALLQMDAYVDDAPVEAQDDAAGALRVDLWLGASQLMGGINQSDTSLYPHSNRRFREGGFHYRYDGDTGWYENVLRDMLATAEGSLTRVLRFGNERIPDAAIARAGLCDAQDESALRSVRRDLLTYAVSPMPTLFEEFSGEKMDDSYYSLGTKKLDQMVRFAPDSGAALENPGQTEPMSALLQEQIAAIASGNPGAWVSSGDADCPVLYALQNIDLSRLSVITFDPAEMRRLTASAASGETIGYLQNALDARGVFDAGLSAGLYAFELDYMGQMNAFASADFAEPVIWGRLKYDSYKKKDLSALPMPRVMLALVVGQRAHIADFTAALNARMDADAALKGLRGPGDGELSYVANGQTVTQQPFSFAYHYASFSRPEIRTLTQHDMTLDTDAGTVKRDGSLQTATLSADAANPTLTLRFPLSDVGDDIAADLGELDSAGIDVQRSLTLSSVLPNEPDAPAPALGSGAQAITVRDKTYVFQSATAPFESDPAQSPFTLASLAPSDDGQTLVATVHVDSKKLKPGYYRLCVSAELSGRQLDWPDVDWIDGEGGLDATVTNEQIAAWERFSALIHQYEGDKTTVPRQFQHAWGPVSERAYHGSDYPDFPPVYRAPGLRELARQLRAAANIDTIPYVRCVFDVFVDSVSP